MRTNAFTVKNYEKLILQMSLYRGKKNKVLWFYVSINNVTFKNYEYYIKWRWQKTKYKFDLSLNRITILVTFYNLVTLFNAYINTHQLYQINKYKMQTII